MDRTMGDWTIWLWTMDDSILVLRQTRHSVDNLIYKLLSIIRGSSSSIAHFGKIETLRIWTLTDTFTKFTLVILDKIYNEKRESIGNNSRVSHSSSRFVQTNVSSFQFHRPILTDSVAQASDDGRWTKVVNFTLSQGGCSIILVTKKKHFLSKSVSHQSSLHDIYKVSYTGTVNGQKQTPKTQKFLTISQRVLIAQRKMFF